MATKKGEQGGPWVVGRKYLIRTVTMILTGKLVAVYPGELVLDTAAWIAETARFMNTIESGDLQEVEPMGNGVIVGRGSVIDAVEWAHPLPTEQR
jgi:hypothetical protein